MEPGHPGSNPEPTTYLIHGNLASTAIKWDTYSKDCFAVVSELLL